VGLDLLSLCAVSRPKLRPILIGLSVSLLLAIVSVLWFQVCALWTPPSLFGWWEIPAFRLMSGPDFVMEMVMIVFLGTVLGSVIGAFIGAVSGRKASRRGHVEAPMR
jgi:hypothetical protein